MTDNNIVSINRRLTREAELKFTSSGTAILKFSIAVNRSVKKGEKWEDEVSFFDCTMFGKMAESVNRYLEKGKQISVLGELVQNRWEKDGQKHSRVEIIVNRLQLLGSKDEKATYQKPQQGTQPSYTAQQRPNTPENFQDDSGEFGFGDDDSQIPF